MTQYHPLLLDIWREACRHIEINDSSATFAEILAEELPLAGLIVRQFDHAHPAIETVATGGFELGQNNFTTKTGLTQPLLRRVVSWAKRGEVLHCPDHQRPGEAAAIVPPEIRSPVFVGPLTNDEGPTGAIVMVAATGAVLNEEQLKLLRLVLEPLSVAMENDRRLRELNALRAAAEADRQSLLTRLGRNEIQDTIVGADSGLVHVMERVELVAQSDVPVLILGETGTGKEVVSRAIHQRSSRSQGPFLRVNCGAIPPELLDSQLFGHEKGSFTGASEARQGWFERANDGTLFLDEIGELPLAAQVRLLRVLQDGYIERVGGQQPLRVDVRIVAATHRDLASMVQQGSFREDLWYRINVFPILLPRLSERPEDIPALACHFAQRAAHRFGLAYVEPTAEDLAQLMKYPWPGNIRELGAVIDRAAILGNGHRLDVAKSLGFSTPRPPRPAEPAVTMYEVVPEESLTPAEPPADNEQDIVTLDEAMKRHIERALVATRGRVEGSNGAAKLLDINPHTLRARMRKLEIPWSQFRQY